MNSIASSIQTLVFSPIAFPAFVFINFPAIIAAMYSSFSLRKYLEYMEDLPKMGEFIGKINNLKDYRILYIITVGAVLIFCTMFTYIVIVTMQKFIIINVLLLCLAWIMFIYAELRIAKLKNLFGVYFQGLVIKDGCIFFKKIYSAQLLDNGNVELYMPNGFKKIYRVDDAALGHIKHEYNLEKMNEEKRYLEKENTNNG